MLSGKRVKAVYYWLGPGLFQGTISGTSSGARMVAGGLAGNQAWQPVKIADHILQCGAFAQQLVAVTQAE